MADEVTLTHPKLPDAEVTVPPSVAAVLAKSGWVTPKSASPKAAATKATPAADSNKES